MDKHTRIAIIGAGISGLNAALTLQDAGLACSIYEASNRIGGRMHSDTTTWADGMVSEWCGEFIDSDHRTILHLIERFRLKTIDLGREIPERAQTIMYFFNRFYDADEVWGGLQHIYPILQQQVQEAGFPTTSAHFTEAGTSSFRWLLPAVCRRDLFSSTINWLPSNGIAMMQSSCLSQRPWDPWK